MFSNKLTQLLALVSAKNYDKLLDFLHSPYFNKSPVLVDLYRKIIERFEECWY